MKIIYYTDARELVVPVGFEEELKHIVRASKNSNYLVKVTVENTEPIRTDGMNSKFHAMCRELANKASDGSELSVDYVKEMAKSMAVEYFGYPQLTDDEGRLQYDSDGRARGMSTAGATSKQFTMLMDSLRMLADEFGYEWEAE